MSENQDEVTREGITGRFVEGGWCDKCCFKSIKHSYSNPYPCEPFYRDDKRNGHFELVTPPQPAAPTQAQHGCRLVIERNLAPADRWHWAVLTPTGHMFAVSKRSFDSPDSCAYDALCLGVTALMQAEKAVEPRAPAGRLEPAQPAPARAGE